YWKLLSDEKLYENISYDDSNYVEYSSVHNLDEEFWFKIENFSSQNFCPEILKIEFDSKEYNSIPRDKFNSIKYILSIQDENIYCFQKTPKSSYLRKKFISIGDGIALEENKTVFTINNIPDAVYFKDKDVLIFRNIATISSVFRGIDQLYREATNEDVDNFLSNNFINKDGSFSTENVSKPNRKRIAMVIDTLSKLDNDSKNKILNYINEYCGDNLNFNKETQKFNISTDNELKILLYGIEQRFYTTPIGNEKRLANSIIKLE
ncbi:TPA: ATP F0F1 synthase synthase, partial [Haemophilus influenzae]